MKRILILILGMGLAAGSLLAQDPERQLPSLEERNDRFMNKLQKKLSLSEQQYEEIYNLHLDYMKQRESIVLAAAESREARHEALKETRMAEEAELLAILDQEQEAKWQALKEEMKTKRKSMRGRK